MTDRQGPTTEIKASRKLLFWQIDLLKMSIRNAERLVKSIDSAGRGDRGDLKILAQMCDQMERHAKEVSLHVCSVQDRISELIASGPS